MTERWFYPSDLADDLAGVGLPAGAVGETLAATWEYNRCVVPAFTNWQRYLALARLGAVAIVAEVFGHLVDVLDDGPMLGYDIDGLLTTLFADPAVRDVMAREYRASLLLMTEKSSGRRGSELMRHYVDALAQSPQDWFRLRDCDGMFRFYIAASIACNDSDEWLSDAQYRMVAEIGEALYDAVAYYKHRAEGEIHNTYAYVGPEVRESAFRAYREALWELDAAWSTTVWGRCAINFTRMVGGPIHMMMRRYRFVEDGLVAGKAETADVVGQARRNAKLWYRIDAGTTPMETVERYQEVMAEADRLLFPGFADMLERAERQKCQHCVRRSSYGAEEIGQFGGVRLCDHCRQTWRAYLAESPLTIAKAVQ